MICDECGQKMERCDICRSINNEPCEHCNPCFYRQREGLEPHIYSTKPRADSNYAICDSCGEEVEI